MSDALRFSLRLIGLVVGVLLGWQLGALLSMGADTATTEISVLTVVLAIGGLGYLLGPRVIRAGAREARNWVRAASVVDIIAIVVGLILGGLIAAFLALPLSQLPGLAGSFTPVTVAIALMGTGIAVSLARKRDLIAPWVRVPKSTTARGGPTAPVPTSASLPEAVVDTSVIIDGRIADILRTGFLDARLLVPTCVLDELQRIADSSDPLRRARGRRGLDALNRLRDEFPDRFAVIEAASDPTGQQDVDALLVRVAHERGVKILTNDHNLDRVARVQGLPVLNVTELTAALRPLVLPGEVLRLRLVQEGREHGQGVGFLDDGTMVVVDGGQGWVGQETDVTVTRLLQTGAGRMVFASLSNGGAGGRRPGGTAELHRPRTGRTDELRGRSEPRGNPGSDVNRVRTDELRSASISVTPTDATDDDHG